MNNEKKNYEKNVNGKKPYNNGKKNFNGNGNKPRRKKPIPNTFKVVLSSFDDALTYLKRTEVNVASILENSNDLLEATSAMINYVGERVPDLIGKCNIHTNLNIASNRALLRTEFGYSFGWYINYTIENGVAVIETVEITFIDYENDIETEKYLIDEGWSKVEK